METLKDLVDPIAEATANITSDIFDKPSPPFEYDYKHDNFTDHIKVVPEENKLELTRTYDVTYQTVDVYTQGH